MRKLSFGRSYRRAALFMLQSAATIVILPTANAQENGSVVATSSIDPDEIIVVAQRREERLQQVPIAVTVIGGALQGTASPDLRTISMAAPSLSVSVYPGSSDTVSLNMRGQGIADAGQITKDGGVGLYVDGFYIARPQAALFDLGDPARIEVLRGPQGTLFGRNTTGGAVNIITTKPTGDWGGQLNLSTGSRDLLRGLGIIDLPSFGNLAIRGTFLYSTQDGWAKNSGTTHDYHTLRQLAGRVAARWTPTENITIDYAFNKGRVDSTQPYYVNPDLVGIVPGYTGEINNVAPPTDIGLSRSNFEDHQLTADFVVSDRFTLRSLSSYRGSDAHQFANYGYAQSYPVPGMFFTVEQEHFYKAKQYTQEFQFLISPTDRIEITSGLYYFRETASHDRGQITDLPLSMGGLQDTEYSVDARSISKAAYLQAKWTLPAFEDRLKLTVGGRYTEDEREAKRDSYYGGFQYEFGVTADQKFKDFSPMANLAIEWTPDIMNYLRYSQGYKAGGVSEGAKIFAVASYSPEFVESWELGLKSQFFNRALTLNAALFSSEFRDIQLDFGTDPIDISAVSTLNAGEARARGFEIEAVIRPIPKLTLNASYTYLNAKLKKVTAPAGTNFDPTINIVSPFQVGDDVTQYFTFPFAPRNSFNVGGRWSFFDDGQRRATLSTTYVYQEAAYTQASAGPAVFGHKMWLTDDRSIWNARLQWDQPIQKVDVSFAIFANNILDRRVKEFVIGVGSQLTTVAGPGGYVSQTSPYSEPRVIGAELRIKI